MQAEIEVVIEHGKSTCSLLGQVIAFAARGPWNDEAMKNGSKVVGRLILEVDKTQPWGQISCLAGEAIMPPSTFDIFVKQSSLRREAGLTALALVICDSDIITTIRQQLSDCYTRAGINHAFFDDITSAARWLSEQGIAVDMEPVRAFYASVPFLPDNLT
ncbi:hypothetical protein [Alteromonas sp. CYL-A6]|uniref:hypothetical protein n=1 Tax=Alteromonas nitratireducens TaxID=3390813 RepID=UPI0034AC90A7